jgi:hypothetical protein
MPQHKETSVSVILLLNQLYNPGWVLACSTIFFQASLSSILVLQFIIGHNATAIQKFRWQIERKFLAKTVITVTLKTGTCMGSVSQSITQGMGSNILYKIKLCFRKYHHDRDKIYVHRCKIKCSCLQLLCSVDCVDEENLTGFRKWTSIFFWHVHRNYDICLLASSDLFVCLYQPSSPWTDFHEIYY